MEGRNLVLIGFMGVGKSTLGKLCAAELGYAFRDSDKVIEQQAHCSVAQLFAKQGEQAFRQQEREVIAQLAATPGLVIATGGGAILHPENVANLRATGFVVLLTASAEMILQRIGNGRSRPLLAGTADPSTRVRALLADRMPHYQRASHAQVNTTHRDPRAIAREIVQLYRQSLPERIRESQEATQEKRNDAMGVES